MPLYPKKILHSRHAQADASGAVANHTFQIVEAALGSPVVDDPNLIVTIANMKNGAYTIAAQPDVPRNITVTHAEVGGGVDTLGTITIVGTDRADRVITEVITPVNGTLVAGTMAFKTVTSVTGAGWVIGVGNDTVIVGTGGLIGLPDRLSAAHPIQAWLNATLEAVLPAMTVSTTVLALNTVDFATAWGGTAASLIYLK